MRQSVSGATGRRAALSQYPAVWEKGHVAAPRDLHGQPAQTPVVYMLLHPARNAPQPQRVEAIDGLGGQGEVS
ncbi:MAG: hypothetical protein R3D84_05155 [Paracoccaceae bacterium]